MRLIRAIIRDDTTEFSALLETTPSLATQSLHIGAERGSALDYFFREIAHYLIAGDTALHAASASYRTAIVRRLLNMGATVAARNRRGATPLHYAADGGPTLANWNPAAQAETIVLLIRAGADPNAFDKSGVAPIHRAVRQRCPAAVEALLHHGAGVALRNKNGSTPLHLAVQDTGHSGSGQPEARACQKQIITILLSHGADTEARDESRKTPRQHARGELLELLN